MLLASIRERKVWGAQQDIVHSVLPTSACFHTQLHTVSLHMRPLALSHEFTLTLTLFHAHSRIFTLIVLHFFSCIRVFCPQISQGALLGIQSRCEQMSFKLDFKKRPGSVTGSVSGGACWRVWAQQQIKAAHPNVSAPTSGLLTEVG